MNGSMLVPMKNAPKDLGITWVVSFAIGACHDDISDGILIPIYI